MTLGTIFSQAIEADKKAIAELIDRAICPDCGGTLEVISENVGYAEYPHWELSIFCPECLRDWSDGSEAEYKKEVEKKAIIDFESVYKFLGYDKRGVAQ